jgi:DNA-binding response OmpR family regulator
MSMKVLIADDNHFYRCALRATLAEWGYEVTAVPDGAAAWDILRGESAPKLAILDWMMPKMDGLEVCRRLRSVPRHEPTYVIVLTSRDGKANIVAALESGADDYITKPFDRDELAARLRVGRRIVELQTSETVIFSFARAVDGKSPYTKGHSDRVTRYAVALAAHLGLSEQDRQLIRRGALLHDIGKIAVPDAPPRARGTDDRGVGVGARRDPAHPLAPRAAGWTGLPGRAGGGQDSGLCTGAFGGRCVRRPDE